MWSTTSAERGGWRVARMDDVHRVERAAHSASSNSAAICFCTRLCPRRTIPKSHQKRARGTTQSTCLFLTIPCVDAFTEPAAFVRSKLVRFCIGRAFPQAKYQFLDLTDRLHIPPPCSEDGEFDQRDGVEVLFENETERLRSDIWRVDDNDLPELPGNANQNSFPVRGDPATELRVIFLRNRSGENTCPTCSVSSSLLLDEVFQVSPFILTLSRLIKKMSINLRRPPTTRLAWHGGAPRSG